MRELKAEELSVSQKLGMLMTANCREINGNFEFALELIRKHALGSIWIRPEDTDFEKKMWAVHEAADYPLLIVTDAESGLGEYVIGHNGALGFTGSEEMAYAFGKCTAVTARKLGYNWVCNPIVDMTNVNVPCSGTIRCMGGKPELVSALACSMARGMHDGGVLCMAKHYPSVKSHLDSHLCEGIGDQDERDLLEYNLKPYLAMMREGLLDSTMTAHARLPKIDEEYPASLSEKVLGILRRRGFDGVMMTDALVMFGVVGKFGMYASKGLAIRAGNECVLGWETPNEKDYEALRAAYEEGVITPERLDEAVRRVLALQHKAALLPKDAEITDMEKENLLRVSKDGVAAVTDAGLEASVSRDGKHFFVLMEENTGASGGDRPTVDTFTSPWYQSDRIEEKLKTLFPNSAVFRWNEYPNQSQNWHLMYNQPEYEDVIFITFCNGGAYMGAEHFSARVLSIIEALRTMGRVSAILHFGNPFLLEETVHIPRRLFAAASEQSTMDALDVLAGLYPAKGVVPYDLKLS